MTNALSVIKKADRKRGAALGDHGMLVHDSSVGSDYFEQFIPTLFTI